MIYIYYEKKGKIYEEYLDVKNNIKDKLRFNYLQSLDYYKHISNFYCEDKDFYD